MSIDNTFLHLLWKQNIEYWAQPEINIDKY